MVDEKLRDEYFVIYGNYMEFKVQCFINSFSGTQTRPFIDKASVAAFLLPQ